MTDNLKTRDEATRDLARRAADQCMALSDKLTAVIDGEDDEGEPETETLRGIGKDKDGRASLVFAEEGVKNARTRIYVDAILGLARMLNGEVQVKADD